MRPHQHFFALKNQRVYEGMTYWYIQYSLCFQFQYLLYIYSDGLKLRMPFWNCWSIAAGQSEWWTWPSIRFRNVFEIVAAHLSVQDDEIRPEGLRKLQLVSVSKNPFDEETMLNQISTTLACQRLDLPIAGGFSEKGFDEVSSEGSDKVTGFESGHAPTFAHLPGPVRCSTARIASHGANAPWFQKQWASGRGGTKTQMAFWDGGFGVWQYRKHSKFWPKPVSALISPARWLCMLSQEAAKKGKDAMLNEHERHQIELNSMRQSSRKQHQKLKELLPALLAPWPQHCCRRRDLERAYRSCWQLCSQVLDRGASASWWDCPGPCHREASPKNSLQAKLCKLRMLLRAGTREEPAATNCWRVRVLCYIYLHVYIYIYIGFWWLSPFSIQWLRTLAWERLSHVPVF